MVYKRLLARLDIKGSNVIKGIRMDGLRVIGPAAELAEKYSNSGADELLIIDSVASLYNRSGMPELVSTITSSCFVPITVGGGIKSVEDADDLFRAGADKIAINTAAIENPNIISDIANKYGSQAVVCHIEAKKKHTDIWECYVEGGREPTGIYVTDWLETAQNAGAGEFLISSVDQDGTLSGMDTNLIQLAAGFSKIPVIGASGVGTTSHVVNAFMCTSIEGVAIGAALHKHKFDINQLRKELLQEKANVRGFLSD